MRIVKTTQGPQDLQARIVELEAEVEKLRKLTERDDLTGCLRRDAFLTLLERRRSFGFLPKTTTPTATRPGTRFWSRCRGPWVITLPRGPSSVAWAAKSSSS